MSAAARAGSDKMPFLRTSNVFWDRLDLSTLDEMAISPREIPDKLVEPGDLLVCEGGEIGRAAIWDGSVAPMAFQNHLHRLRPKLDDIEARFYVYFLQSAFTQLGIFDGAGNKTTIPNLSSNSLAALEVPQPPLIEQLGVVTALRTVQAAVSLHDNAVALALELKGTVMERVFTRGLRGEELKDSELGPVPESWTVGRLDAYASVLSTRMSYAELEASTPSQEPDAVRVLGIKVSDMNRPGNEVDLIDAVLTVAVDPGMAEYRCAPPGTIIFPKRGAAIATNKKRFATEWTAFDPNVIGVLAQERLNRRYLFHWFQAFDLRTITEPGPTPQLNKKNLEPIAIPVPPTIEEQDAIVEILDALDQKVALHRSKRAVLEELFLSLLYKLMIGEVDIEELNLLTERTPHSTAVKVPA